MGHSDVSLAAWRSGSPDVLHAGVKPSASLSDK